MPNIESAILDRMDARYRAILEAAKKMSVFQTYHIDEETEFFEVTRKTSLPLTDRQIARLCQINIPGAI